MSLVGPPRVRWRAVSPARASEPDARVPTHPALHVSVPVDQARFALVRCQGVGMFAAR